MILHAQRNESDARPAQAALTLERIRTIVRRKSSHPCNGNGAYATRPSFHGFGCRQALTSYRRLPPSFVMHLLQAIITDD